MKPLIGVVSGVDDENNRYRTAKYYETAVEKAGGVPVIIPYVREENTDQILSMIHGIIFTGGGDIQGKYYNEETVSTARSVIPERDEFEIPLCQKVVKMDMPYLGICRGSQVLNVAMGGSLLQQVSGHWFYDDGATERTVQDVRITEGSLLHRIYNKTTLAVNSAHYQAVGSILGKDVKIAAAASDGIIESTEVTGKRFVLGVQWHPEILIEKFPEQFLIFKKFLESAVDYKNK